MDEFSVYQFFPDETYEEVLRFVSAEVAFEKATALTRSVGARIGTTQRVIITDGGDCTSWEWEFGKGVIFPTQEDIQREIDDKVKLDKAKEAYKQAQGHS